MFVRIYKQWYRICMTEGVQIYYEYQKPFRVSLRYFQINFEYSFRIPFYVYKLFVKVYKDVYFVCKEFVLLQNKKDQWGLGKCTKFLNFEYSFIPFDCNSFLNVCKHIYLVCT